MWGGVWWGGLTWGGTIFEAADLGEFEITIRSNVREVCIVRC